MKQVIHECFQEVSYHETLDNGLRVIVFHKPNFQTSTCIFATPYGALDVCQMVNGNVVKHNPGIAHFLEHKLFENEENNVFNAFASMGCEVNAFTSYNETFYHFTTTSKELEKPLHLLLDFVQNLAIDEESVEKEKGIIIQELRMYDQNPDFKLIKEVFASLFLHHPLKYDIGGDEESVKQITLQELEECYKVNYHPSNMTVMVVTPNDPLEIISSIKKNQASKVFLSKKHIEPYIALEPKEVVLKQKHVVMDIQSSKVALVFKLHYKNLSLHEKAKYEWAIRMIMEMHFSTLNEEYQTWIDEKRINDFFGTEIDFGKEYALLMFFAELENVEAFQQFIIDELKKITIHDKLLTQLKNRYFGRFYGIFDDVEVMAISYLRALMQGVSYDDMIDIVHEIDIDFLKHVLETLDLSQYSLVSVGKDK